MRARLLTRLDDLRTSYWFIPSLMVVGALSLAFGATLMDSRIGAEWIEDVPWIYAFGPDGARACLSTIAGSMIGVAGVTFSITIASVVYASGQYGPRLLTNFMSDRGNQVTLGTFIATFLYCLLILSTVRSADESSASGLAEGAVGEFVPHIAILIALALALASVAVLIYFIHHVPESIHVSNVIAGIGRDLRSKIDVLFPERIGKGEIGDDALEAEDVQTEMPDGFLEDAVPILADSSGYVQGIDTRALLSLATKYDVLVRVRRRPGDFTAEGDTLALVGPSATMSPDLVRRFRVAFAWGTQRTALQDVRFLVNELVEIAGRALSPGVNDPFTAMTCLDWLTATLKCLGERDFPSADRYDASGTLRVIAQPTTFHEFVRHVYGQLRPYLAADRNAALHAMRSIGEVAGRADEAKWESLRCEADALHSGAMDALPLEVDRLEVRHRYDLVVKLLTGRAEYEESASTESWIGGTA
ncbi:MAG: DUF2254 domain-containing protein [Bacteroidota bacterium]